MTTRTTNKELEALAEWINKITDSPVACYEKDETGKYQPQAGCYHISGAYGGVALHRMSMTPGCTGVTDVFGCGHMPKKELAARMRSFIRGVEAVK